MLTFKQKYIPLFSLMALNLFCSTAALAGLFPKESKGEDIWHIKEIIL